jgi:hypothetical protein
MTSTGAKFIASLPEQNVYIAQYGSETKGLLYYSYFDTLTGTTLAPLFDVNNNNLFVPSESYHGQAFNEDLHPFYPVPQITEQAFNGRLMPLNLGMSNVTAERLRENRYQINHCNGQWLVAHLSAFKFRQLLCGAVKLHDLKWK